MLNIIRSNLLNTDIIRLKAYHNIKHSYRPFSWFCPVLLNVFVVHPSTLVESPSSDLESNGLPEMNT